MPGGAGAFPLARFCWMFLPCSARQRRHGKAEETLCLPGLRRRSARRWAGQCADCAEWNSLVEDADGVVTPFSARHNLRGGGRRIELVGLDAELSLPARVSTGIAELDRAMGGGLVAGSATLMGGDPGIGKSTLLLQAAAKIAAQGLAGRLYFRRGGGRSGAPARAPARARRGAAAARRGDLGARYPDHARRSRRRRRWS